MATRRVFANIGDGQLLLVVTERSTVVLEPMNLEFETIEDAVEYVIVHPEQFSGEIYAALLEQLWGRGGGGL